MSEKNPDETHLVNRDLNETSDDDDDGSCLMILKEQRLR